MTDVAVAPERPNGAPHRGDVEARPLARRSSLPAGRAVVGGFLIALSALGIFAAYSRATAGPTATYVVARHDIPVGARLTGADLTTLPMDLPAVVADTAVFTDERRLVGATTIGPIRRGELVQAGAVLDKRSAENDVEVSFEIDSARALAGALRSGDRVDLHATFGVGGDTYTVSVVKQALVLATSRRGGVGGSASEVITLAVRNDDEALAVTHAVNAGEVTLVRTTGVKSTGTAGQTYRSPAARDTNGSR
jgi:Flp pilus assembly protein CpaB